MSVTVAVESPLQDDVRALIAELNATLLELTPPELPSEAYREALIHYRLRQPLIEADLRQAASAGAPDRRHAEADTHLTRGLEAALVLGDMRLLDGELDWLQGLLTHHGIPEVAVRKYVDQHHQAAAAHLDGPGRIVVDWLAQSVERLG